MAALRDTDGLLNNDMGFPESPHESQGEPGRSRYANVWKDSAHQSKANAKAEVAKADMALGLPSGLSKISPEFGARLERLTPQQKIRAVVMLETERSPSAPGGALPQAPARRHTPAERQVAIARIRSAAQHSLEEIRPILEAFHAHLLAPAPDALGAVPVEIDAAGILALAQSSRVRTILEDQEIRGVDGMRSHHRPHPSPFSF